MRMTEWAGLAVGQLGAKGVTRRRRRRAMPTPSMDLRASAHE